MNCKNCLSPNAVGATHCTTCRMPGDFGSAAPAEAPIVQQALRDCCNCGSQAPVQASKCPTCRWPLPQAVRRTPHAVRKATRAA